MKRDQTEVDCDDADGNRVLQKRPRLESLPLPSADEFLREKAAKEKEGIMEEQSGGRGQGEEAETAADGRANRQGIGSSTASEMLATCSSAAMKEEADSSDTEYELVDEVGGESDDDMEAKADRNLNSDKKGLLECSSAEFASMAAGLVASSEHLRAVRVPLFMVRLLAEHGAGDCLRGCLVGCHVYDKNKIITDEIDHVTAAGEVRFKHTPKAYLLKDLQNRAINHKLFDRWIKKMVKWGEPLPPMADHKKRLENVFENCNRIVEQMDPAAGGQDRQMMERRVRKEMNSMRSLEKRMQIEQANGTAEQNLKQTHQKLLWYTNNNDTSSSSSDDDDDAVADEATGGELPMDKLVHTKELLDGVCLSYDIVLAMVPYPDKRECLSGCLVKCRTRNTNEIVIDEIAKVNPFEIEFKHSRQPFLLEELCVWDEQISSEMFAKWIEDMTRWDEPLPSIRSCGQQKNRALRALQMTEKMKKATKKETRRKKFEQVFGKDTRQIIVEPQRLVQLHQLGEAEFTRVVTGLFVRVRYSLDDSEIVSLEQIRTVSFDHWPPYTIYGHRLTVRLYFERPEVAPVPILNVLFYMKNVDHYQLIEHHTKICNFVPPSAEFIQLKREQLRSALSNTSVVLGKANPAWLIG